MKKPAVPAEYFGLPGLVAYLGNDVSERVLRDIIKSGDLPHFRVRGKILVSRSDVDAWLQKCRVDRSAVSDIVDEFLGKLS